MMAAITAAANDYICNEKLSMQIDSMPATLTMAQRQNDLNLSLCLSDKSMNMAETVKMDKEIRPYTFFEDQTYVGIPLFLAGVIAKQEKHSFRQDYNNTTKRSRLIKNTFHNELDNYTQFAPAVLAMGLNLAGVEGRSNFGRFAASSAMSYALMAAIVNPIKYGAKEMRPDGSTANSFPSGHTATAFVSATILHKEYGLTVSPWYSVAGYGVATATGVMRVLNNRHWVSDVLAGAGIGIFATEVAYGLSDLIFKGKGLKRNDLTTNASLIDNPSFFSISMGMGFGSKTLSFSGTDIPIYTDNSDVNLKFRTSTVVGAEGAYFFNPYVGVGGRLRVRSTPISGWEGLQNEEAKYFKEIIEEDPDIVTNFEFNVESSHITEFAADLGLYFCMPIGDRFAIGTKALIGRIIIQDLDIKARFEGYQIEKKGDDFDVNKNKPYDTGVYDYLTVSGDNTMKYGTGLSLTYAYKSNFSWKLFFDYDFTRKHYTMEYDYAGFLRSAWPTLQADLNLDISQPSRSEIKKNLNNFVLGGAFCVSF